MAAYTIVFSNYTASLFAWLGEAKKFKKMDIGNREIIGEVMAHDEVGALAAWRATHAQNQSTVVVGEPS